MVFCVYLLFHLWRRRVSFPFLLFGNKDRRAGMTSVLARDSRHASRSCLHGCIASQNGLHVCPSSCLQEPNLACLPYMHARQHSCITCASGGERPELQCSTLPAKVPAVAKLLWTEALLKQGATAMLECCLQARAWAPLLSCGRAGSCWQHTLCNTCPQVASTSPLWLPCR